MEGRLEKKLENYANDQFLLRNTFIKIKASSDVTLGKLEATAYINVKITISMEGLTEPSDSFMKNTLSGLEKFKKQHKKAKDVLFAVA